MLTRTPTSRLLRFLLSLALRFRLSTRRIALVIRAHFSSFWKSILALASRRDHSWVRLHASDAPSINNDTATEHSRIPGSVRVEGRSDATPTAPPIRPTFQWEDELARHRALTSGRTVDPDPVLVPAIPGGGSRCYRPGPIRQRQDTDPLIDIPAGQQNLLSSVSLPDRWTRHVHPGGVPLFFHKGLHVFTESDIKNPQNEDELLRCAMILVDKALQMSADGVTLDEFTEIVLNVDDQRRWHYYFVDHTNRLLFWVDKVSTRDLGVNLPAVTEYNHIIRIYGRGTLLVFTLAFQFIVTDTEPRSHCEHYPHNRTFSKHALEELRGMLNYTKTDMMTTDSSSSPFAQDELVAILDLANALKDDEISNPYSVWIIARLMAYFSEHQFLNFCGQPCARLNTDKPLSGQQFWNHSYLFRAANVFLCGAPSEHAVRLQCIWVDGIIIQPHWKALVNRFKDDLGQYTILSTVMLAVNISFLAVPSVVDPTTTASVTETLIYCSVVLTVASIVFSLGFLNFYSNSELMVARHAVNTFWMLSQDKSGMAGLAITHSLPVASLTWSIILFSVALAVQIFGPGKRGIVVTLGVELAIIMCFVIMGIKVMRMFWEDETDDAGNPVPPTEEKPQSQVARTGPKDSQQDVERGLGAASEH